MVRRNKSFALQQIAQIMYVIGWRALFGADPLAKVEDDLRKKLAQLILDLYQRWCDAMMYPGPRCADEHHGVYLGCAEIDRSGRIVAFDPWEHRRYVVTGATLGYWAGQFGIASLDVIVGRFAQAICCLAKLPPLQARWEGRLPPVLGVDHETDRIHVGTASTATKFAAHHGAKLRWVPNDELSRRAIEAFIRRSDGGALEALGTQLADGGSIAILVPLAKAEQPGGKVRTDVKDLLRRGALRTRERSRDAVADFAIGVLAASPATAVLPANAPESTVEVAKLYSDAGGRLLGVLEAGAAGVLVRSGGAPELAAGADDLVDRAELALDALVTVTVETLGPKLDRASFGADNAQAKLADAIAKKALPKVDRAAIALTAKSVARG
jgi:hypothetical protein